MNDLVPEHHPGYSHVFEGGDDMPAHLKSSLGIDYPDSQLI